MKQKITGSANTVLQRAAEFAKVFEGFSSTPYWDYKQWTWGHGTFAGSYDRLRKPVGTISKAKAFEELKKHMEEGERKIRSALTRPVTDEQMIALLSFNLNLGFGNTLNIIRRINEGRSPLEVAEAFKLYVYAGGKILPALQERRKQEAQKYLSV